jgi:hypothetical protein
MARVVRQPRSGKMSEKMMIKENVDFMRQTI